MFSLNGFIQKPFDKMKTFPKIRRFILDVWKSYKFLSNYFSRKLKKLVTAVKAYFVDSNFKKKKKKNDSHRAKKYLSYQLPGRP